MEASTSSNVKASPLKRGNGHGAKRRLSVTSNNEEAANGAGSGDEADIPVTQTKKRGGGGRSAIPANFVNDGPAEYRFAQEIAQMIYVFTEIEQAPLDTAHIIEDIVRGQVVELLVRARTISHHRASRYLTIEDLIFLIRQERGKVNRLRSYLSWKEVRKSAKKDDAAAGAGVDIEVEDFDGAEKKPPKKQVIKLPWELVPSFHDILQNLKTKRAGGADNGADSDDEADDAELEAYEDSIQRLRHADAVTRRMSKEQYVKYSECRQASFTFRKAKRFRDFINTSAYLDLKPNDDVLDILGFLCFEMVRSLCVAALEIRNAASGANPEDIVVFGGTKEDSPKGSTNTTTAGGTDTQPDTSRSVMDRDRSSSVPDSTHQDNKKDAEEPETQPEEPAFEERPEQRTDRETAMATFNSKYPLLPSHILQAYAHIQRDTGRRRSGGLRNWVGGPRRSKVALI